MIEIEAVLRKALPPSCGGLMGFNDRCESFAEIAL
jgi:hypothetical protein